MKQEAPRQTGPTFTPAFDAWPDAGVYQLWIELRRPVKVAVGARGVIHFTQGMYIYTGRAARNLRARVRRHVQGAKRLRWHIDYLLAQRSARVAKVVLAATDPAEECHSNRRAGERGGIAVPGFGASDCRNGCPGHLWRVC